MEEVKELTMNDHATRLCSGLMTKNREKTQKAVYDIAYLYVLAQPASDQAESIVNMCDALTPSRKMLLQALLTAFDRGDL